MKGEHTQHGRRAVDRLQQLVADGERRLREHVDLIDRIEDQRNLDLAAVLLRQYSAALELLRGRLEMEQRERDSVRPLYPASLGRRVR